MDGLNDLVDFAKRLESATIATIESGIMTKDLVGLFKKEGVEPKGVNSFEFLNAIAKRLW